MILSGEKLEEYRDCTPYYDSRFIDAKLQTTYDAIGDEIAWKEYDTITFSNGYSKTRPQFEIEFKGFEIGIPTHPEWGGVGIEPLFILKLGKIIKRR